LNLEKLRIISEHAQKISKEVPSIQVFSTLGNHVNFIIIFKDVFPVDQLNPLADTFFNKLARIWSMHNYTREAIDQSKQIFKNIVLKGGYYSMTVKRGLRVISLNTQWTNDINFFVSFRC
jgi:c-di-AMP phosphodiesterase-like protein